MGPRDRRRRSVPVVSRDPWVAVSVGPMGDRLYVTEGEGWNVLAPAYSEHLYLVSPRTGQLVQVEPVEFRRDVVASRASADAAVRRFLGAAVPA